MNLDRIISVQNSITVFRDGDRCLKVFNEDCAKADVINEALNQARMEETTVPVPAVEADPFLGDRLCPADGGDPYRLADLRLGAGGEFRGDLFVCRRIFDRFYGIWLGDLLLLVHAATSDAYGVFLLDHFRLAKRIVHADQQYAGMGAEDHAGEPGALFRGCDAYGLFKGERLCRFTGTFCDCLSICCFF